MDAAEEKKLLDEIAMRISSRQENVPQRLVESVVGAVYANFHDVRIRDFVPFSANGERPRGSADSLMRSG